MDTSGGRPTMDCQNGFAILGAGTSLGDADRVS